MSREPITCEAHAHFDSLGRTVRHAHRMGARYHPVAWFLAHLGPPPAPSRLSRLLRWVGLR